MPAIDLGYLLGQGTRAATGYRQGQREQQEANRKAQIEDAERLFTEWAKRQQFDFQNRQLQQQMQDRAAMRENTAAIAEANRLAANQRTQQAVQGALQRTNITTGAATQRATTSEDRLMKALEETIRHNRATEANAAAGQSVGGGRATEAERRGAALYQLAAPSAERIRQQIATGFTPSIKDILAERGPDVLTNWAISPEGQTYFNDLANVIMATQYAVSGASATETEAKRIARTLMPRPGDSDQLRKQKEDDIQSRLKVLESLAGRAAPSRPAAGVPGRPSVADFLGKGKPPQ